MEKTWNNRLQPIDARSVYPLAGVRTPALSLHTQISRNISKLLRWLAKHIHGYPTPNAELERPNLNYIRSVGICGKVDDITRACCRHGKFIWQNCTIEFRVLAWNWVTTSEIFSFQNADSMSSRLRFDCDVMNERATTLGRLLSNALEALTRSLGATGLCFSSDNWLWSSLACPPAQPGAEESAMQQTPSPQTNPSHFQLPQIRVGSAGWQRTAYCPHSPSRGNSRIHS